MAFCTACGTQVDPAASNCPSCGAALSGRPAQISAVPPVPPPPKGTSGLKIVLMILGGVVLVSIAIALVVIVVAIRIGSHTHVRHTSEGTVVESPFGNVETSQDSQDVIQKLGIEMYPGASLVENTALSMNTAGHQMVAATFESSDSADQVFAFYKERLPKATAVKTEDHKVLTSHADGAQITITIEEHEGSSRFHVTRASK